MVRRLEGYRLLGCRFDLDKSIFFDTMEEPERGLGNDITPVSLSYLLTYLHVTQPIQFDVLVSLLTKGSDSSRRFWFCLSPWITQ